MRLRLATAVKSVLCEIESKWSRFLWGKNVLHFYLFNKNTTKEYRNDQTDKNCSQKKAEWRLNRFNFSLRYFYIIYMNFIVFHQRCSELFLCIKWEVSAPPLGLDVEQRLHHSLGSRGVCRGWGPHQLPWSAQFITQSHQSRKTPLHHLLWRQHPAERVSWDAWSAFSSSIFFYLLLAVRNLDKSPAFCGGMQITCCLSCQQFGLRSSYLEK